MQAKFFEPSCAVKLLMNWWSEQSTCSSWCRLDVQCPSSYGKYRRVLHCHTWWSHQCVPEANGHTRPRRCKWYPNAEPMFCLVPEGVVRMFSLRKGNKIRKRLTFFRKSCSVVGFHNRGSYLRATPHSERDLALLSIVHGEAFQHQATKTRSSSTTACVVHAEALQS